MKIKLLSQNAKVPVRGSEQSAGYDLYVPNDTIINPGRNIVKTDISISLEVGYEAQIRPRSGFSAKGFEGHKIADDGIETAPRRFDADVLLGTIDSDFRGNIGVIVKSYETKPFMVAAGTRIAQMVIGNHWGGNLNVVDELDNTERGDGGFNSTGTH